MATVPLTVMNGVPTVSTTRQHTDGQLNGRAVIVFSPCLWFCLRTSRCVYTELSPTYRRRWWGKEFQVITRDFLRNFHLHLSFLVYKMSYHLRRRKYKVCDLVQSDHATCLYCIGQWRVACQRPSNCTDSHSAFFCGYRVTPLDFTNDLA